MPVFIKFRERHHVKDRESEEEHGEFLEQFKGRSYSALKQCIIYSALYTVHYILCTSTVHYKECGIALQNSCQNIVYIADITISYNIGYFQISLILLL